MFPCHGNIEVSLEQAQFLSIKGQGPFNRESIAEYIKGCTPIIEAIDPYPWVNMVYLEGLPLMPPDATELLLKTTKYSEQHNLAATALILPQIEYQGSVRYFWQDLFDKTSFPVRFFDTASEAKSWLLSKLPPAS